LRRCGFRRPYKKLRRFCPELEAARSSWPAGRWPEVMRCASPTSALSCRMSYVRVRAPPPPALCPTPNPTHSLLPAPLPATATATSPPPLPPPPCPTSHYNPPGPAAASSQQHAWSSCCEARMTYRRPCGLLLASCSGMKWPCSPAVAQMHPVHCPAPATGAAVRAGHLLLTAVGGAVARV
jgi:hypothetical protein